MRYNKNDGEVVIPKYSSKTPTCLYILGHGKILIRSSYIRLSYVCRLSVYWKHNNGRIEQARNTKFGRNIYQFINKKSSRLKTIS